MVNSVLAETPARYELFTMLRRTLHYLGRDRDFFPAVLAASAKEPQDVRLLKLIFRTHLQ